MKLGKIKIDYVPNILYSNNNPMMFYTDWNGWWSACRDGLQAALNEKVYVEEYFLVKTKRFNFTKAVNRISRLEKTFKVRSRFLEVESQGEVFNDIFYVSPHKFWLKNALRISIFTATFKNPSKYFKTDSAKYLLKKFKSGWTKPTKAYSKDSGFLANISDVRYNGGYPKKVSSKFIVEKLIKK